MNNYNNYLKYIQERYSDFRFLSDKNSLEFVEKIDHIHFKWIENRSWFAWIFIDNNISPHVCFFWYLEILWDFEEILIEIKEFAIAHNCKNLVWPINLSIWNSYRFSDVVFDEVILGEYENNPNQHEILLQWGFTIHEEYLTVHRNGTNPFTHYSQNESISIERIEASDSLEIIYGLSCKIFDTAPSISYQEFLCYMQVYEELYKDQTNIFLLKKHGQEIGFVSSFCTDKYFVIKTIGVLQEYRKNGYWNMLLDYLFQFYFKKDIYESYGIYMRKTGEVMHMSDGGGDLYRKYFTYLYTL